MHQAAAKLLAALMMMSALPAAAIEQIVALTTQIHLLALKMDAPLVDIRRQVALQILMQIVRQYPTKILAPLQAVAGACISTKSAIIRYAYRI
jgi:hypothetical protein